MTQTALLERIQQQGTPVSVLPALGQGTVTRWHVKPGQLITAGTPLAVFVSEKSIDEITAPISGKVTGLMVREGTAVHPEEVVAYITPQSPTGTHQSEPKPAATANKSKGPPSTHRRSTMLELELLPPPEALIKSRRRTRSKRPKIVKFTCDITNEQVTKLRSRAEGLREIGGDYALAELERVAFDLLLSLSDSELVNRLETRRDLEEQERYGYGNRPGY